ncbi:hypothetical protein FSP39_010150 [Pinctada imbricata]|uniref:Fringe-like glycosyltransferase domain-containing protein n=1 Tax=Pinctada imbricata TaxID=66713 RepID=A0AA88XY77_PINIB|nr:hypothetical protein FSP39_010150 [Pinctada imbricata]
MQKHKADKHRKRRVRDKERQRKTQKHQTQRTTHKPTRPMGNRCRLRTAICHGNSRRRDLCCKFAMEYDHYIRSGKSWFCHVDDDNYLNVDLLLQMLRGYDPSELWYLGRASRDHPVTPPRKNLITLGFSGNVITIKGFDVKEDPTRFKSLHCKLHPKVDYCSALKQNITN